MVVYKITSFFPRDDGGVSNKAFDAEEDGDVKPRDSVVSSAYFSSSAFSDLPIIPMIIW